MGKLTSTEESLKKWSLDLDSAYSTDPLKTWISANQDKAWRDRITKQIIDAWEGSTPVPVAPVAPEPVPDYEPVQIDRRRDQDFIEKLTGDNKLLIMVLAELVSQGKADFLFIEYPEIQQIWHGRCSQLGKLRAKEREQKRIQELKESGLSKLTEEEKKALGIK